MVITNYVSAARQFLLWLEQQSDVSVGGSQRRNTYDDFIQMKVKFETTAWRSAEEPFASPEKVFRSDPSFVADAEPELAATGTAGHRL